MIAVTLPASRFWLALALGLFAGLADYLGGFLLVLRSPSARALRYFVALGRRLHAGRSAAGDAA